MIPIQSESVSERFIATSLGQISVVSIGQGDKTVVLWPSIFTDRHIYGGLVKALGSQYRFLLIDGPGHGRSPGIEREFSMVDCGEAIAQVMNAFELENAVVGGTSWGGMAAAELALQSPERVSALILMNTPMEIGAKKPSIQSRMITFGSRWMLRFKVFRNGVAKSFFNSTSLQRNKIYAKAFHTMLRETDSKRLSVAVSSVLLHGSPLKARLSEIKVPTLVIAGIEDSMYPLTTQATAALHIPQGRFDPVPGQHISVIDALESVTIAIHDFLSVEAG